MRKIGRLVLPAILVFSLLSLSCSNPITSFLTTRTAVMKTATATQWTPTPTNTPTATPTATPTITPTPSPTPIPRNEELCGKPATAFSYILPDEWELRTIQNSDCSAMFGPRMSNGSFAAIFVSAFSDSRNLEVYAAALVDYLEKLKQDFRYTNHSMEPFQPDAGGGAVKIIGTLVSEGDSYFDALFVFKRGSRIVLAEYMRLEGEMEELDPEVESIMRSFRFD